MIAALIERACTIVLIVVVILRAPAARQDPRARHVWVATLCGALGLLCRGTLISPDVLDAVLGGKNWLNLVQNLFATAAFWLGARAVLGLARDRVPRMHLLALAAVLVAITLPFVFIDKGETTAGRMFIAENIKQTAMLLYVMIYTATIGALAVALLFGIRRRRSRRYIPFRIGTAAIVLSTVDEILYATAAHWGWLTRPIRADLYLAFTPLFYPGLILVMIASLLFAAARARQRRRALRIIAAIAPSPPHRRPKAGAELVELYEVVVQARDSGPLEASVESAVEDAEKLLSQYLAYQLPDFRRPVTYRGS